MAIATTATASPPAGAGAQRFAVEVAETTARRHITGMMAMNIPDPAYPGGDWHQESSWFGVEPESLPARFYTNEETYSEILDRLGTAGVKDARPGLRILGHPAGERDAPVWTAAYDRAIVEIAWKQLVHERRTRAVTDYIPVESGDVQSWLFRSIYWIRLNWWGWRLRWALTGEERRRWDKWRRKWRPW